MNEEQKRSYEGRELSPVERAAIKWWKSRRPAGLSENSHIANADVNCADDIEAALARSVSGMVRVRKQEKRK